MSRETKSVTLRKMQWQIFLLGLFKIPMIGYLRPRLILLDDNSVELKIKLTRRSKNHLNSMYFGALAVGADVTAGIHAFYFARKESVKVSFAFKGLKGDFIKRAESDVIFKMTQGQLVKEAINNSITNDVRVNRTVEVNAFDANEELVATFELIVSVRVK